MKPLFQHLENESLLLLYMVGELPDADRQELELLLARDGGLRAQLASLRAAHSASFGALAQLDAVEHVRATEPALRPVDRAILQWQVDRMARPAKVATHSSKMPIWAWSATSAVAALLVFCIWWGFRSDNTHLSVATQPYSAPSPDDNLAWNTAPQAPSPSVETPPDALPVDTSVKGPTTNPDANASVLPIVTVDADRIGDLERRVSDDLQ